MVSPYNQLGHLPGSSGRSPFPYVIDPWLSGTFLSFLVGSNYSYGNYHVLSGSIHMQCGTSPLMYNGISLHLQSSTDWQCGTSHSISGISLYLQVAPIDNVVHPIVFSSTFICGNGIFLYLQWYDLSYRSEW